MKERSDLASVFISAVVVVYCLLCREGLEGNIIEYRDLLIVLPMREPSIFRGIAVSLLRPVIGSNFEIE